VVDVDEQDLKDSGGEGSLIGNDSEIMLYEHSISKVITRLGSEGEESDRTVPSADSSHSDESKDSMEE
jgi:hypothetical protein